MSLILAQANGRLAAKQVLRGPVPNLTRFNVEPSKLYSFRICASQRNQNRVALSRFASFYDASMVPVMGGMFPAVTSMSFKFSFGYINYLAKSNPWLFGLCTACTKAVLADIIAQKFIEGKEKLNLRRTALFFTFGALYSGGICNVLYSWLYPMMFRSRYLKLNAIASSFCDNFINTPFIMMPTLYVMKECFLFEGGSFEKAFKKYKAELWESSLTGWKIWIPAHMITFGVIPTHLRIPYVSCVSFFFFTAISIQQNEFDKRRRAEGILTNET